MIHHYSPKSDLLQHRVILVTGASSGIGHIMAKAYAKYGATVILLARSLKKLEALYDEIEKAGYPKPAIYPMNLANATPKDYQDLQNNIDKHFGRLDGLLLNAGMLGSLTPIEHYSIEQWYQVLQVNLNSQFLLSQATLPLLKRPENASIIFTLDNIVKQGKAYWGAYGISKYGCLGLMKILAAELEENTHIRVNGINPGYVQTKLRAEAYPAEDNSTLLNPEALLPLYLYLMGPDSLPLTGETLDADADLLLSKSSYKTVNHQEEVF